MRARAWRGRVEVVCETCGAWTVHDDEAAANAHARAHHCQETT